MTKIHLVDDTVFWQRNPMAPRRKLSAHQRQIRFFIALSIVIIILATTLIFWLLSRPKFSTH